MTLEQPPAEQGDDLTAGILCLRAGAEPADWFLDQVHALGAVEWAPAGEPDDEAWLAQAVEAVTEHHGASPVHVIAAGTAVPRALLLAARRPDLVISVLAGDPEVDESDPGYWELLRQVHTPTLVVVAAPRPDSDISQAQTVAGGIDNGVMVVVDGTTAPVHRSNPHSFAEWVTAFMSIAEGLRTLTPQPREEARA
ncbi:MULTISPECIES: alpha/beta fold hydrolase [unclassified Geodermatophilus]|uniref:alpha/beta fold hydrolase n=1 Tax=unclassified Geodermatophilus TaxID=2637632 RepID=UPI003EEBD058